MHNFFNAFKECKKQLVLLHKNKWFLKIRSGNLGGTIILRPCWFSHNNSETVKAVTLAFHSIE